MRPTNSLFSSQVASLGDSENATNKQLIFKPSGFTWRLGKCGQTKGSFSSQVASLGGSENATKYSVSSCSLIAREREAH
jgi:hypothetical protein